MRSGASGTSPRISISRRSLVQGIGTAALFGVCPIGKVHAESGSCPVDLETNARIIDSARDLAVSAKAIRESGVSTVIRYYARGEGQWCGKVLSPPELAALDAAGLSVAVVFQNNNDQADYFYDEQKKILDVEAALGHAKKLGQPAGTPIYFGADFDLRGRRIRGPDGRFLGKPGNWAIEYSPDIQRANEKAILAYFEHANDMLRKHDYRIGVYGCGATCELLGNPKRPLANYFWISASVAYERTSEFYNSGDWHLFQNKVNIPSSFVPLFCEGATRKKTRHSDAERRIDSDVLNPKFQNFGQWRRDGSRPVQPADVSAKLLQSRAFVNVGSANIYSTPSPGRVVTQALYGRNVRLLCDRGNFVAVSMNDGDQILGYCRKTDLTTNLVTMPPWPKPR